MGTRCSGSSWILDFWLVESAAPDPFVPRVEHSPRNVVWWFPRRQRSAPCTFRAECEGAGSSRRCRCASCTFPAECDRAGFAPGTVSRIAHSPRNVACAVSASRTRDHGTEMAHDARSDARSEAHSGRRASDHAFGLRISDDARTDDACSDDVRSDDASSDDASSDDARSDDARSDDARSDDATSDDAIDLCTLIIKLRRACQFHLTGSAGFPGRASRTIFRSRIRLAKSPGFVVERGCYALLVDIPQPSATCRRRAQKMSW
jgi:hypothetical protein